MSMFWTIVLATLPMTIPIAIAIAWRLWGRARARAGIPRAPRRRRWPSVILVGPAQSRGQAALVDEGVALGQDLEVDGEVWRVSDLEDVGTAGGRRAWLLNISEDVKRKLDLAARTKMVDDIERDLEDVMARALEPFWSEPWSPEMIDILNHQVRVAICDRAERLRWIHWGVTSSADLPPRGAWPLVRLSAKPGAAVGMVEWSVRPMAESMARRAR